MNETFSFLGTARTLRRAGALISCSALFACGSFDGGTHDLGSTADLLTSTPPDAGTGSPLRAQPIVDFIGVWQGQAQDPFVLSEDGSPGVYQFPSGSTSIELTIGRNGATIRFGGGEAPPVTDLERGYPLDAHYTSEAKAAAPLLAPIEGLEYLLRAQTAVSVEDLGNASDILTDGVLRLFYHQNQFARDWCAAQTPAPAPMQRSGYGCLGAGGYGLNGDECSYAPFDPDADPTVSVELVMDRSTLGHNLRPLERDGLVALGVDAADKRAKRLSLTAAGKQRLNAARPAWQKAQADFEARFGKPEAEALRSLLSQAVASTREQTLP